MNDNNWVHAQHIYPFGVSLLEVTTAANTRHGISSNKPGQSRMEAVQQIPAGVPVVLSIIVLLQHFALTGLVAPLRVVIHQEVCQQACLWV